MPSTRAGFTRELRWAICIADSQNDVDIVVSTGAGSTFSAGGDLKESIRRLSERGCDGDASVLRQPAALRHPKHLDDVIAAIKRPVLRRRPVDRHVV